MNRLQLFKEMYEMSTHNLLCYSKDYLMTKPKPKFIKEWKREHEKVELLKGIIAEEKQKEEIDNYNAHGIKNKAKNEETEEFE